MEKHIDVLFSFFLSVDSDVRNRGFSTLVNVYHGIVYNKGFPIHIHRFHKTNLTIAVDFIIMMEIHTAINNLRPNFIISTATTNGIS